MNELISTLKAIFPESNPYETSGIQYGVILRLPNGYYKIYEKGVNYLIQQWDYDHNLNHEELIPKQFVADYFRQLTGLD